MKTAIPLKDLVTVSLPNPTEIDGPVKPWAGMERLFAAEDCNRYTFAMTRAEAASLPPQVRAQALYDREHPPVKRYPVTYTEGRKAYEELLRLALGMEDIANLKPGEQKYVIPQWEQFKAKHPERVPDFEGLIDMLRHDVHIVNSHTDLAQLPRNTAVLAAKHLMKLQGVPKDGEKQAVLVVAGDRPATTEMLRSLGGVAAVGTIALTSDDPALLASEMTLLHQLQQEKKFASRACVVPVAFEKALDMTPYSHVVICRKAGDNPLSDARLMEAWKRRGGEGGVLLHYASLSQKPTALAPWKAATLNGFAAAPEIEAEQARILLHSQEVLAQAEQLIHDRAVARHMISLTASQSAQWRR